MRTIGYEETKENYTGPVSGRTWVVIAILGAVAVGIGSYLGGAFDTEPIPSICDIDDGCIS